MREKYRGRTPAAEIRLTEGGETMGLTYIGSGSNCMVYKINSQNENMLDVIKEFDPLIADEPAMERKGAEGRLVDRDDLTDRDRAILNRRRGDFFGEKDIISELEMRYKQQDDNMILVPRDIQGTSLGRCQLCKYVGGKNLRVCFEEAEGSFSDRLRRILPLIISLFDDLAFYHLDGEEGGILNLDVRPENIFAISFQGRAIGVRNLDFGSARRIYDRGDKRGILSEIRARRDRNVEDISSELFANSPLFYDTQRINGIIERTLSGRGEEELISDLKQLDIIAALKTLLLAFCSLSEWKTVRDRLDEEDAMRRIFAEIFEQNPLGRGGSLLESYNIYTQLHELFARATTSNRRFRLSASEIANRLRMIRSLTDGICEGKTEEQRAAQDMSEILSTHDRLFADAGLHTISDILAFNNAHGLKDCESPSELIWFIRFGEKRKKQ